ncbi:MAG: ABC transporter permease [Bauldia sp.]
MARPRTGSVLGALYWIVVIGGGGLALVFLVGPVAIALLMSFTDGQTLQFPPEGLSLRWYEALFDPAVSGPLHTAAFNSLKIAAAAVFGALLFAVPAAVGIVRVRNRRTASLFEPLLIAPLILPSLVYGLAALVAANLIGLSPSFILVVIGHVIVFGPLMYRATNAIASQLDPSLEEASSLSGATWARTFRKVTLPLLLPGILAGVFLVFMQSLDNVSVTLFLADPSTSILPLRMFAMLQEWLDVRVAAISGVLIGVTLLALILGRRVGGLFRLAR